MAGAPGAALERDVRVTHAFLPLLRRSAAPVVVNVSSGLGSIGYASSPDHPAHRYPGITYAASKATVNMITAHYAKAFPTVTSLLHDPELGVLVAQPRPGPVPPSTC
jgi:NAD(P)-dependent dehydrogenase (short-subunit alcohol dehydrogenase family)